MQRDTTPPESGSDGTLFSASPVVPGGESTRSASPKERDRISKEALSAGDELEIQLARMQFIKGAYTRLGIDLERHFHPDPLLVTDLDLLSIEITARLTLSKTVGEAKSGRRSERDKPLDRAIWIAGLKQLVDAEGAIVITRLQSSARARETVRTLGVTLMQIDELKRWEATHLSEECVDFGAQGPTAFFAARQTGRTVKKEPRLERIYWFLRSEVWFLDAWQATKRLVGALAELHTYWTPAIDDNEANALRWLYAESISVLTLQLVVLVGRYQATAGQDWADVVSERLAEGAIPATNQRALSAAFDKYLGHVLGELRAPASMSVETMGAFNPEPPEWTDSLIELVSRLDASPGLQELPRHTDVIVTERLVRRRRESDEVLAVVSHRDPEDFARLRRLIAAFLRGAVQLPEAVDKALTS